MEARQVAQSVPVAFTPGPWALGSRYGRSRTEVVSPDGHKALATVWTHRAETDPHKNRRDDVLDEEGAWEVCRQLGPGDLDAVPGFVWARDSDTRPEDGDAKQGSARE